jgi:AraC-like DNA-binding protein
MTFAAVRAALRSAAPLRAVYWAGGDHPELRGTQVNRPASFRLIRTLAGNADHWLSVDGRLRRFDLPVGCALIAPPRHPILGGDHSARSGNLIVDADTVLVRHFRRPAVKSTVVRSGTSAAGVIALAQALLARGPRPPDDPLLLATVDVYWRHACELLETGDARLTVPTGDAFTAACCLIDEDLSGELDRDTVARAIGVHPNHLSRVFHQSAGMGYARWVAERRLDRARRLIREGLCTVGEAGRAVGFSSPSLFSQVCRRLRGHPPTRL